MYLRVSDADGGETEYFDNLSDANDILRVGDLELNLARIRRVAIGPGADGGPQARLHGLARQPVLLVHADAVRELRAALLARCVEPELPDD
jgi:hypothetical protein